MKDLKHPDEDLETNVLSDQNLYSALDRFWHPVMYSSELPADRPVGAVLLEERIVLARLEGEVQVFRDLCPHRGTALSLGWVEDDCLRCAYHGWKYGADGRCTEIPARFGTEIPPKAQLKQYRAAEQAGLIWVCLADAPEYPVPEFPYFEDPSYRCIQVDEYEWECSAQRRVENYVDMAHFAWVHDGVLGDSAHPEVPDHDVWREGGELRFVNPRMSEPATSGKNKSLPIDSDTSEVDVSIDYRLFMPFTVLLDQWIEVLEQRYLLFFSVCPTGPTTCKSFTLMGRDYSFGKETDQEMLDFNDLVIGQDRPIVQSQRPEELPVDLTAEIQIRGADRICVEYRRWLREIAFAND